MPIHGELWASKSFTEIRASLKRLQPARAADTPEELAAKCTYGFSETKPLPGKPAGQEKRLLLFAKAFLAYLLPQRKLSLESILVALSEYAITFDLSR